MIYQVTNAQNVSHLNARTYTCDHGVSQHFKGSRAVAIGVIGTKVRCIMPLQFELQLNTRGILAFLGHKNLKHCGRGKVGLYVENCLPTYTDMNFFLVFNVGNSLLKSVQAFQIHPVFTLIPGCRAAPCSRRLVVVVLSPHIPGQSTWDLCRTK
jgi:hypothetical protein